MQATFSLGFLDDAGKPLAAPREWEPGRLVIDAPGVDWMEIAVSIQGDRQDVFGAIYQGRRVATVAWPRRSAGHWTIRVVGPCFDETTRVFVRPDKLDEATFETMLDDIDRRLTGSILFSLDSLGAFAGRQDRPPQPATLAEEHQRLRRAILGDETGPGIARLLVEIARDPHVHLATDPSWVRADQARRPLGNALVAALTAHGNARPGSDRIRLDRVVDGRVHRTLDAPENRLLRAFAEDVRSRLARLAVRSTGSDAATTLATSLQRARRAAAFLDEVGNLRTAPTAPSMVLMRRPDYCAVWRRWIEYRRSASLTLASEAREAPLENAPTLYELWGALVVLESLLALAVASGWVCISQSLLVDKGGWIVDLDWTGRAVLELAHSDGRQIIVTPQRSFGAYGPFYATSFGQRPDLVIELRTPGEPPRLLILDPKYKLAASSSTDQPGATIGSAGPTKADIDKMHAYRDAIRDRSGRRPITSAAIIYPGLDSRWFPDPDGGIGALGLRPGEELPSKLAALLEALTGDQLAAPSVPF